MKLQGRVALVTGAGTGIGRALALGLAHEGADVVVNYLDNEQEARLVCQHIETAGRHALAVQAESPASRRCARCSSTCARRSAGWTSWSTTRGFPAGAICSR